MYIKCQTKGGKHNTHESIHVRKQKETTYNHNPNLALNKIYQV